MVRVWVRKPTQALNEKLKNFQIEWNIMEMELIGIPSFGAFSLEKSVIVWNSDKLKDEE